MEDWQMTPEGEKSEVRGTKERETKKEKRMGKSLTAAQLKVLKRSHNNLRKIIMEIEEMNDLYLSDIRELTSCFYDIGNEFLLDNSSYYNYKDPDDAEELSVRQEAQAQAEQAYDLFILWSKHTVYVIIATLLLLTSYLLVQMVLDQGV